MAEARGIYLRRMDGRGRIFANNAVRLFAGLAKGEDSGVNVNIGLPRDPEIQALVIINDEVADQISSLTKDQDLQDFDVINLDETPLPSKRIQDHFRQAEIKSNRIQFSPYERKKLNLPQDDNRVILQGGGVRFLVWPAAVFAEKFPDLYERFASEDDDDE